MSTADDDLYHGIGLLFLTICPAIGASFYLLSNIKSSLMIPVLNGFAGGVLFGFGFLHSLSDAVGGIESDYPFAFLIAGSTCLFLFFVTSFVEPLVKLYYKNSTAVLTKELVDVNSFWCALLVHGCFEGLAVGGLTSNVRWVVIGVLFPHKIVEYAALTSALTLAEVPILSLSFWGTIFTAEIPTMVCFIVSWQGVFSDSVISTDPSIASDALFAALCAGTFIYLSLGHLIPEALALHGHHHHISASDDAELIKSKKIATVDDVETPTTETGDSACVVKDIENKAPGTTNIVLHHLAVYLAIGLGWTVFALFALAPDGG